MRASWWLAALVGGLVALGPTLAPAPSGAGGAWAVVSARAAEVAPAKKGRRRPRPKAPAPAPAPAESPAPAPPPFQGRGPTRIDLDDRLVQGQTNQSGAVVLFARKASGLRSMVDKRKSFRERTLRTVFDR